MCLPFSNQWLEWDSFAEQSWLSACFLFYILIMYAEKSVLHWKTVAMVRYLTSYNSSVGLNIFEIASYNINCALIHPIGQF